MDYHAQAARVDALSLELFRAHRRPALFGIATEEKVQVSGSDSARDIAFAIANARVDAENAPKSAPAKKASRKK